jgi:hypothetical protein
MVFVLRWHSQDGTAFELGATWEEWRVLVRLLHPAERFVAESSLTDLANRMLGRFHPPKV